MKNVYGVSVLKKYDPVPGVAFKKNALVVHSVIEGLKFIEDRIGFGDIKRVFKMTGRYKLMDSFDLSYYESTECAEKYVLRKREPSWRQDREIYPFYLQMVLWSFPVKLYSNAMDLLYKMFYYSMFTDVDIEHSIYKEIDKSLLIEVPQVHVGHYRDCDRRFEAH